MQRSTVIAQVRNGQSLLCPTPAINILRRAIEIHRSVERSRRKPFQLFGRIEFCLLGQKKKGIES